MTTQNPNPIEAMRKNIGVESEPSIYEIEKEAIRRWADAIGDNNPLYHDEEYCKKLGYRSLVAPPSFIDNYAFPVKTPARQSTRQAMPTGRALNGGNEYECYIPVQAGDTISVTSMLSDVYQREGRLGLMTFSVTDRIARNQKGEKVCVGRHIGISY